MSLCPSPALSQWLGGKVLLAAGSWQVLLAEEAGEVLPAGLAGRGGAGADAAQGEYAHQPQLLAASVARDARVSTRTRAIRFRFICMILLTF